jgi:hypothetical protein
MMTPERLRERRLEQSALAAGNAWRRIEREKWEAEDELARHRIMVDLSQIKGDDSLFVISQRNRREKIVTYLTLGSIAAGIVGAILIYLVAKS